MWGQAPELGFEMVTFLTFLARYGVGGGTNPRRRMPKVSLMAGFEKPPPRGRRLCPRRRAVDRAAVGNVKMWNCGSVKVWKYENGLGLLSIARCDDACGEYSCQFNGFSDKGIQLAMFNVVAFNDDLEPHSCLGEFFHRNLQFMDEVFAGFRLGCFGIVGGNACCRAKYLIGKTVAADFLYRQCSACFDATCCKFHYAIFKLNFHGHTSFPYFHIFTVSYLHNFTILSVKPFDAIVAAKKPIVKVPRINIDVCSHFHKMLRPRPSRIGASPRIGRASRSDMNRLTGSVGIIPNIISWRNGVRLRNRIMEAAQ